MYFKYAFTQNLNIVEILVTKILCIKDLLGKYNTDNFLRTCVSSTCIALLLFSMGSTPSRCISEHYLRYCSPRGPNLVGEFIADYDS